MDDRKSCATDGCPYEAKESNDFCWECDRYRSWPSWRKRLSLGRPGDREPFAHFFQFLFFSLLTYQLFSRLWEPLEICNYSIGCAMDERGPLVFSLLALAFITSSGFAMYSFYKAFVDRDLSMPAAR